DYYCGSWDNSDKRYIF
nr:immunoglobulin light chain junction region [Macaca mulatta]MOV68936.1 immunoglobulin light chain junction region [Macaca mulatta]MOV70285.1 immunoglobulin light chain junction region [Macaca mulatta]MOV70432.1 immunoglobulin light chain junction region [Macaca mulatta]MOV71447.1 immunoglobulin light chain junction region [Macaca mulatta]